MNSNYDKVKEWRRNTKQKLFEGFGGKCCLCGIVDDPVIYDFHHLDPSCKQFRVSSKVTKWTKLVEEANKCIMLCSHCHRKVHFLDLSIDTPIKFDESLIVSHKNNRWNS